MAENTSSETSSTKISSGEPAEPPEPAEPASVFGDDDLGRIQGILFGDHARKTDERLNVMEIALLGAIADLREETAAKLDAIDSRITAEAETRDRAVSNLGSKVGREMTEQTEKLDAQASIADEQATRLNDLRSEVESAEAGVKKSLETVEATMAQAIADTRAEIATDKVDRADLATLFRALGDQLGDK